MSKKTTAAIATAELLTAPEEHTLKKLEAIIGKGQIAFTNVATALMEIRDGKLYREKYGTFADYCEKRWKFGRQRAYSILAVQEIKSELENVTPALQNAAEEKEVSAAISTSGEELLPLRNLPKAKRAPVFAKAVKLAGGKPTRQQVKEAVRQETGVESSAQKRARIERENAARVPVNYLTGKPIAAVADPKEPDEPIADLFVRAWKQWLASAEKEMKLRLTVPVVMDIEELMRTDLS